MRIVWQDDRGRSVSLDAPAVTGYLKGWTPTAEPEYPTDKQTDAQGWTEVSDTYLAPSKATRATIELHLQWAPPGGRIEWSEVSLAETAPPAGRKVRLAAAHFRPSGKSAAANRQEAAPLIAEAAKQKADLIVLGETLPYFGLGKSMVDTAEPVPGPTTEYFGALAKQHNLYIVVGLVERDGHLVYNTAVALGPDGKLVGKYRKVCLPRGEVAAGIAPGHEYPVFDTRFGKLGMMVCYDGFFPEVARELTNRGAEVIAWPVWGCNPSLASARACENHVYLVSSTYEDISSQLDADRRLRPRRPADRPCRKVGHDHRHRGGPRPAPAMEQPGRLQSRVAQAPAAGRLGSTPRLSRAQIGNEDQSRAREARHPRDCFDSARQTRTLTLATGRERSVLECHIILGIAVASGEAGFEPLCGAAGTVGTHDGRADGDPRGARFEHAIEVFFVDSADREPGQRRRFAGEADEGQAGELGLGELLGRAGKDRADAQVAGPRQDRGVELLAVVGRDADVRGRRP